MWYGVCGADGRRPPPLYQQHSVDAAIILGVVRHLGRSRVATQERRVVCGEQVPLSIARSHGGVDCHPPHHPAQACWQGGGSSDGVGTVTVTAVAVVVVVVVVW